MKGKGAEAFLVQYSQFKRTAQTVRVLNLSVPMGINETNQPLQKHGSDLWLTSNEDGSDIFHCTGRNLWKIVQTNTQFCISMKIKEAGFPA